MRRLSFLLILPALLALGDGPAVALAAPSTPCAPPATEFALAGTFPAPPLPIFDRAPILQVTLTGQSGAFEGHVVLQPVPAGQALSDGCQENSRFTVTAFTGTLTLTGTLAAQLFGFSPVVVSADQPTDASIQVHF